MPSVPGLWGTMWRSNVYKRLESMLQTPTSAFLLTLSTLFLFACSSQHVLVKKADMEAADQCLLAQQASQSGEVARMEQQAEMLALLRQTLELQQQNESTLQEFLQSSQLDPEQAEALENCEAGERLSAMRLNTAALDKAVVGGREKVLLTDLGVTLDARIDTGATTSSLDARDIESFERDGENWVRFKLYDPDMDEMVELERKRARRVRITQSNTEESESRPVVEMRMTLGSLTQPAEFTLSDRSHLTNPILIGRNVLRDMMIVDVGLEFTLKPDPPGSADNGRGEDE